MTTSSLLWICIAAAGADDAAVPAARTYQAADSLSDLTDSSADAAACLRELSWQSGPFRVQCVWTPDEAYDSLVRFPSPRPTGNDVNDLVALEWYAVHEDADDEASPIATAPAVLVIHESGSRMPAGRMFARELQKRGLHAFMIQLPYYGVRRGDGYERNAGNFAALMQQGIADVRRGYDAIAAIPEVDTTQIAVQGTSLGGFVASTAASLDGCFDGVFIMLAGGDLYGMLQAGEKDTAKLREELAAAGIEGDALKQLLNRVEPTRVAHRLEPDTTWIYSAVNDEVVPIANARRLAQVIELDKSHHVELLGGHYSVAVFFAEILDQMTDRLKELRAAASEP